jgi:hypothetical protein
MLERQEGVFLIRCVKTSYIFVDLSIPMYRQGY